MWKSVCTELRYDISTICGVALLRVKVTLYNNCVWTKSSVNMYYSAPVCKVLKKTRNVYWSVLVNNCTGSDQLYWSVLVNDCTGLDQLYWSVLVNDCTSLDQLYWSVLVNDCTGLDQICWSVLVNDCTGLDQIYWVLLVNGCTGLDQIYWFLLVNACTGSDQLYWSVLVNGCTGSDQATIIHVALSSESYRASNEFSFIPYLPRIQNSSLSLKVFLENAIFQILVKYPFHIFCSRSYD